MWNVFRFHQFWHFFLLLDIKAGRKESRISTELWNNGRECIQGSHSARWLQTTREKNRKRLIPSLTDWEIEEIWSYVFSFRPERRQRERMNMRLVRAHRAKVTQTGKLNKSEITFQIKTLKKILRLFYTELWTNWINMRLLGSHGDE